MATKDHVHLLMPDQRNRIDSCPDSSQGLDDRWVAPSRLVDGGPNGGAKYGPAVHVLDFQRHAVIDEHFDRAPIPEIGRPVEADRPGRRPRRRVNSLVEQIDGGIRHTEEAGAGERLSESLGLLCKTPDSVIPP